MGDVQLNQNDEVFIEKESPCYATTLNPAVVEEQPFYKKGMSAAEIQREVDYLNHNLESVMDGSYMPLWKQRLIR